MSDTSLSRGTMNPVTEPFELVCVWLEAALNCKNFLWSPDQADAARGCIVEAREQLKRIHELAIHLSSEGVPDKPMYTRKDVQELVAIVRLVEKNRATKALPLSLVPSAWMKGFRTPSTPSEPFETYVECCFGDEPPDNQDGWVPLYRQVAQETSSAPPAATERLPAQSTHRSQATGGDDPERTQS